MTGNDPAGPHASAAAAFARLEAGDAPSALALFTELLQQDPSQPVCFLGAGQALEQMGDDAGAEASFRHAITLSPDLAAAHGALAALAGRRRNWDLTRSSGEAALALDAGQFPALIALAQLALNEGRWKEALTRLHPVIDGERTSPQPRAQAHRLAGQALEKLDRRGEAFAQFAASAAIFRDLYAETCAGPEPLAGLDLCQTLLKGYEAAEPQLWRGTGGASSSPAAGHVFMLGFPRSGTTLLEQVLAGHPDVVALEERPTLVPAIDAYLNPPNALGALAALAEETAERWRADYWARVESLGAKVDGKLFIDKQPFYGLWLPLIGKLFPEAKIIVTRRDPRDVVFSCFRNPFRMTPVTYELMDLERGAALYVGMMRIIELCLVKGANPALIHRHEDLVQRFDETLAALCAFLGLKPDPRMAGFVETAAGRDIRTPSAGQVTRGLNRDGIGAWKPYAEQLQPVLPTLDPIAVRYGYAPYQSLISRPSRA